MSESAKFVNVCWVNLPFFESEVKDLAAHSKVFAPVFEAAVRASEWRQVQSAKLTQIAKNMDTGDTENVLAAIIDPAAGAWHKLTTAQIKSGKQLKKLWSDMLQKTAGLSPEDAERFITKDFSALRQAGGDINRFGGIRNSYPKSLPCQPNGRASCRHSVGA